VAVEDNVIVRIKQLIAEGEKLSVANQVGQTTSRQQSHECSAWLAAAQNSIHLICASPEAPYRANADRIVAKTHGLLISSHVGELAALLRNLLIDTDAGLLASVADQARAETFDDFLDHGDAYLSDGRKNEAGVIGGVVFEDTLRRICRKVGVAEKGVSLEDLISELARRNELTAIKAKRARAASHVRTKASHAQWGEFELNDVRSAIEFTRELISEKLDS
jgi:hypothetical protein